MNIYIKANPHLFDKCIEPIQRELGQRLGWLDNVFGITERLTEKKGKKTFSTPNMFVGDRYIQVLPCRELGNFCFFALNDPQTIWSKSENVLMAPYSLIFWYDVASLTKEKGWRNKEYIKEQILGVLRQFHLCDVTYSVDDIYDEASNIFKGYDYDFVSNQSMMQPYAGLRIDGELRVNIGCLNSLIIPNSGTRTNVWVRKDSALFDAYIEPLQIELAKKLDWLDNSFGIAEILTEEKGGKRYKSAGIFKNGKYVYVMPCREIGNFCFFYLKDPQKTNQVNFVKSSFSAVFWADMRKVSTFADKRNLEVFKEQILAVMNNCHYRGVTYTISKVYTRAENVFKEFSYDHTLNQYMMHPYCGIRVEGEIRANVSCFTGWKWGDYNEDFNEDFNIIKI